MDGGQMSKEMEQDVFHSGIEPDYILLVSHIRYLSTGSCSRARNEPAARLILIGAMIPGVRPRSILCYLLLHPISSMEFSRVYVLTTQLQAAQCRLKPTDSGLKQRSVLKSARNKATRHYTAVIIRDSTFAHSREGLDERAVKAGF